MTALLLGFAIFSMLGADATPDDKAGALLLTLVVGIPAAGFCIVLLLGAGLLAATSRRNASRPEAPQDTSPHPAASHDTPAASARPASRPGKGLNFLGFLCLAGAVLWTVPNGFLFFVTLVTGDEKMPSYFLFWFLPAAAMFATGKALRSTANRG